MGGAIRGVNHLLDKEWKNRCPLADEKLDSVFLSRMKLNRCAHVPRISQP